MAHPQDVADRAAADAVRCALRDLHNKVQEARRRGLKVDIMAGAVGYDGFDPCSTAVVTIVREQLI